MSEKETKPYKRGINPDTANLDEIHRADDRLVDYIDEAGLPNASSSVQDIINRPVERLADKSKKDPNTSKILTVQKKILEVLEKIEANMFDEQDTSIKHGEESSTVPKLVSEANSKNISEGESGGGFGLGDLAGLLLARKLIGGKSKKGSKKGSKKTSTNNTKKGPKKRSPKKTSKIPKGLGGLAKKSLRFMKFAGPVGVAITAGLAISDGLDGWDNAAQELGTTGELSTANKASAALGGVVSGLSFGMLDSGDLSKGINNATGGNKIVDKYEKEGIIDHEVWGDSEITDWKKLAKLKAQEIQKIIDIDDWSDSVRERLEVLKTTAQAQIDQSKKAPISLLEPTPKSENVQDVQAVKYTMKTLPMVPVKGSPDSLISANKTSTEPSSYKPSDLFKLYNVKNSDFDGMNPNMLSNLKSMAAEYRDIFGESIQINSAFRSIEEQQTLKKKFGSKAAKPGYSMHNYGLAVDMNTVNADNATAAGLFKKYGFKRPVRGETWHVEPKGIDRKKIRTQGLTSLTDVVQATVSKTPEPVQQTPDVSRGLKEGEPNKEPTYKRDTAISTKSTTAAVVQDDTNEFNITKIINDSLEEERLKDPTNEQTDVVDAETPKKTKHTSSELAELVKDSNDSNYSVEPKTPKKTKHTSSESIKDSNDSNYSVEPETQKTKTTRRQLNSNDSVDEVTPKYNEELPVKRTKSKTTPVERSEFDDLMNDSSDPVTKTKPKAKQKTPNFDDFMHGDDLTVEEIRKSNAEQQKKERLRVFNLSDEERYAYDNREEDPKEKSTRLKREEKIETNQSKKRADQEEQQREKKKRKDSRYQAILDKNKAKEKAKERYTADKKAGKSPVYSDILAEEQAKIQKTSNVSDTPVKSKKSNFDNFMSDDSSDVFDDSSTPSEPDYSTETVTSEVRKSEPVTRTVSMTAAEIAKNKKELQEYNKPSDPNSAGRVKIRERMARRKAKREAAKLAETKAEANKTTKERTVNGFSSNLTKETAKFKTPQGQNTVQTNALTTQANVINTEQKSIRSLELFSD